MFKAARAMVPRMRAGRHQRNNSRNAGERIVSTKTAHSREIARMGLLGTDIGEGRLPLRSRDAPAFLSGFRAGRFSTLRLLHFGVGSGANSWPDTRSPV